MKERIWLIVWGLASLVWLSLPFWCEIFGGDERLLSCRDGRAMAVDVLGSALPEWGFTFEAYTLWFGPPIAVLLLVLVVKWIVRGIRCNG